MDQLPTPPMEDQGRLHASKRGVLNNKTAKAAHRVSKRGSVHGTTYLRPPSSYERQATTTSSSLSDGRHKRVWKACERCRMKKTKCDGEFPCKRCRDDGLVCTAGTRKKMEYKQLPRGYAEVLENTQLTLIATVHKLYAMVRNGQGWDLGEPDLNDRGQPVVHNIAAKLGCIRPNSDLDLPVHSVFPEDEAGLAELAAQLEAQQKESGDAGMPSSPQMHQHGDSDHSSGHHSDRASSSDLESHSDLDHDYRRQTFGGGSTATLSPKSLSFDGFDRYSTPSEMASVPAPAPIAVPAPANRSPRLMPPTPTYGGSFNNSTGGNGGNSRSNSTGTGPNSSNSNTTAWVVGTTQATMMANYAAAQQLLLQQQQQRQRQQQQQQQQQQRQRQYQQQQQQQQQQHQQHQQQQQAGVFINGSMDLFRQGLLESEFGTIKPHVLSCPNPEVMMGIGDPMISSGYENEALWAQSSLT